LARRRGFAVTHLEREPEGRGASVRNFGLVWVSERRAGPELALALRARGLWESIAADAPGTGFRPHGSLTIAGDEAELAVPALRASLAGPDYTWLPGLEAVEVAANGVRDQLGTWHRGDLVVLCTGANFTGLAGPHLTAARALAKDADGVGLRRVRLQMLQTDPLPGSLTTSVADGDSLRYYPAFDVPSRDALPAQVPVAAANRAQLLL